LNLAEASAKTDAKDEYRHALSNAEDVSLWHAPWWLDATADHSWNALTIQEGGRLTAALPYVEKAKLGVRYWGQPPFTQAGGPWLEKTTGGMPQALAREEALLTALADLIPPSVFYQQNWTIDRRNWLPWKWAGFSESTRYTYRLGISDLDSVWKGMAGKRRTSIRKARKRSLTVDITSRTDLLTHFVGASYKRRGVKARVAPQRLARIAECVNARDAGFILVARIDGDPCGACLVVRDNQTSYYVAGGADERGRNADAQSLLLVEAIERESATTSTFDFEGSMDRDIGRFFRSYGSSLTPYHAIRGAQHQLVSTVGEIRRHVLDLRS
jgi:hypothetical protein